MSGAHGRASRLSRTQRRAGSALAVVFAAAGSACLFTAPVLGRWQPSITIAGTAVLLVVGGWFAQQAADHRTEWLAQVVRDAVEAATRPLIQDVAALATAVDGWANVMTESVLAVHERPGPEPAERSATDTGRHAIPLTIVPSDPTATLGRTEQPANGLFAANDEDR